MKRLLLLLLFPSLLAGQSVDSLVNALKHQSLTDTSRVNTLNSLAYHWWINGDDSLAKDYSLKAIALGKKLKFTKGESNGRLQLVRIEMDILEDIEFAYAHLDTVDRKSRETGDELMSGVSHLRRSQMMGSATSLQQPKIDSLLEKALDIFKKLNSPYWESIVYGEKATYASWEGDYITSIEMLLKARKLQEALGDEKALRATLPNLAVTYSQVGMYKEALEYLDKAEKIITKSNEVRLLAFINKERGQIYSKQNNPEKALAAYAAAAEIYRNTHSNQFLSTVYARMSELYFNMGRFDESMKSNIEADSLYRISFGNTGIYHYTQANFGKLFLRQKNYRKVIELAEAGLRAIEDANSFLLEERSYHNQLSQSYFHLGDYKRAYDHLSKYKTVSDSIFNDETKQKILASTMTYEFDKMKSEKDMEIQQSENKRLLQSRNYLLFAFLAGIFVLVYVLWVNRRLKKYNKQLIHKNREIEMALDRGQKIERRRVASELHDNLNTKLAALRWSLESLDTDQWSDTNQSIHKRLLTMAADAYKDVRLISHNMLPPELEEEGLPSAFRQLTQKLNELGDIRFNFYERNMNTRLSKNEEHQLYNIALEAVNNVLKHAQATMVEISISLEDNIVKLVVSDNGTGMDEMNAPKGMGINNITNRAESIGGKVHIESALQQGTTLRVTLPFTAKT